MKTKIVIIVLFLGIFCSSYAQTGGIVTIKVIPTQINQYLSYASSLGSGENTALQLHSFSISGTYNNRSVTCEMDSVPEKGSAFDTWIEYIQNKIVQVQEIELKGKWHDTKKDVFKLYEIIVKN